MFLRKMLTFPAVDEDVHSHHKLAIPFEDDSLQAQIASLLRDLNWFDAPQCKQSIDSSHPPS